MVEVLECCNKVVECTDKDNVCCFFEEVLRFNTLMRNDRVLTSRYST
jgi:hypothetical protein